MVAGARARARANRATDEARPEVPRPRHRRRPRQPRPRRRPPRRAGLVIAALGGLTGGGAAERAQRAADEGARRPRHRAADERATDRAAAGADRLAALGLLDRRPRRRHRDVGRPDCRMSCEKLPLIVAPPAKAPHRARCQRRLSHPRMRSSATGLRNPRQPGRCSRRRRHAADTPAAAATVPRQCPRSRSIRRNPQRACKGGSMSAMLCSSAITTTSRACSGSWSPPPSARSRRGPSCSTASSMSSRVHETIEEEIFYPTLKQHPRASEIVLEGYEEHDVVEHPHGRARGAARRRRDVGPEGEGHDREHRAPHRGGGRRDVREGSPGVRSRRSSTSSAT